MKTIPITFATTTNKSLPLFQELQSIIVSLDNVCPTDKLFPICDPKKSPKFLLPISNKPLLFYHLLYLIQNGIYNPIIIIVNQSRYYALSDYIQNKFENDLQTILVGNVKQKLDIIIHTVGDDLNSLQAVEKVLQQEQIRCIDLLILQPNFITTVPLLDIYNSHRRDNHSLTMMIKNLSYATETEDTTDSALGVDYFGHLDTPDQRIVFFAPGTELVMNTIRLKPFYLSKWPHSILTTKWMDCQFYILKKTSMEQWLMNSASEEEEIEMTSVREHFIPFLIRKQQQHQEQITCHAYVLTQDQYYRPCQTIANYNEIHRDFHSIPVFAPLVTSATTIPTTMEGCIIKKSFIGSNCKFLGNNIRMTNSIIMDHVTIHANTIINNSIVCSNAVVESNSILNNSQVGYGFIVEKNSNIKNEMVFDEQLGEEDQEEEEEDHKDISLTQ